MVHYIMYIFLPLDINKIKNNTKTLIIQWCKHTKTSTKFGAYTLYFPIQLSAVYNVVMCGITENSFTDSGSETQRGSTRYGVASITTSYATVQQFGSQYLMIIGY